MGTVILICGFILLNLALRIGGFFKIILWLGSVVMLYYAFGMLGLLDDVPANERTGGLLFFVGLTHVVSTVLQFKTDDGEIVREITDILIHILGLALVVIGIIKGVA